MLRTFPSSSVTPGSPSQAKTRQPVGDRVPFVTKLELNKARRTACRYACGKPVLTAAPDLSSLSAPLGPKGWTPSMVRPIF